ncbi:MAG: GNAT family N-acetyltransferase [Alphaproteobacteria bacterium]
MTDSPLRPVELFDSGRHVVERFDSGVAVLDDWIARVAGVAAAADTAATWVLCRRDTVGGYYSLAMGSVDRVAAPSRLGRGHPDPVPVLLLARLALDRSEQGSGLGADLLCDALARAVAGARHYGARAMAVDAIDAAAAGFYRHHGFVTLDGLRLYRRIADIERSIES